MANLSRLMLDVEYGTGVYLMCDVYTRKWLCVWDLMMVPSLGQSVASDVERRIWHVCIYYHTLLTCTEGDSPICSAYTQEVAVD